MSSKPSLLNLIKSNINAKPPQPSSSSPLAQYALDLLAMDLAEDFTEVTEEPNEQPLGRIGKRRLEETSPGLEVRRNLEVYFSSHLNSSFYLPDQIPSKAPSQMKDKSFSRLQTKMSGCSSCLLHSVKLNRPDSQCQTLVNTPTHDAARCQDRQNPNLALSSGIAINQTNISKLHRLVLGCAKKLHKLKHFV